MTGPVSTRGGPARPAGFFVANALFLLTLCAAGAAAVWPMYADPWFLVAVGAAVAAGGTIAIVTALRRARWWWVAIWTAGAYVLLGVPFAVPAVWTDPAQLPSALLRVLVAPVTGWKDVLTLPVPLGTFQATLAPAFLLFLVVPVTALTFACRARTWWALSAAVALVPTGFGILFGTSAVSAAVAVGPFLVPGLAQAAIGLIAFGLALGWCMWRQRYERAAALRAAQHGTRVRVTRSAGAAAARWALAVGMLAVAAIAAVAIAPLAVAGDTRDVLRTNTDPDLRVRTALSPLTTYREFFSDSTYDEALFTVDAPAGVDRVRLATLSFYDGVVARVTDPSAGTPDPATALERVPSTLAGLGRPVTADVSIGAYSGLWVPTVGTLTSMAFDGPNRAALTDGFFYAPGAQLGVELADPGLTAGVSYRQDAVVPEAAADPATLTPPGTGPRVDPADVPQSLVDWIAAQGAPTGGAGLVELTGRLRARGYLSHALTIDQTRPPAWMGALGDYTFEPSRAGHSTDRIDALFTALLQRQNEVGANAGAALVAAPGDDEQFAVAAALIADQLGFPARIVLGARLAGGGPDTPTCQDGVCRGADMSAWIEVQDASGTWTPIDVTPQHEHPIAPDLQDRRDPQNVTDVPPENAQTVLPPDSNPVERAAEQPSSDLPADLSGLWATLRIGGIAVLLLVVLAAPFLAILVAKLLRRRARRRAGPAGDRVTGGWDEYVDAAVDHGGPLPAAETRQELAALYDPAATGAGTALATWADRSVFSPVTADDAESRRFWELVDAERARLARESGWWARLRARLSLRSFRRALGAPREGGAKVAGR
ncbi:transglutaminase domain-containing protein [Microbacterium sp. X-17]|uniref:transglutaminase domain-containing protein n=1 Tax=Microbacterium sp. X-17 TaxID=3144404 RepID=UPI0031F4DB4A